MDQWRFCSCKKKRACTRAMLQWLLFTTVTWKRWITLRKIRTRLCPFIICSEIWKNVLRGKKFRNDKDTKFIISAYFDNNKTFVFVSMNKLIGQSEKMYCNHQERIYWKERIKVEFLFVLFSPSFHETFFTSSRIQINFFEAITVCYWYHVALFVISYRFFFFFNEHITDKSIYLPHEL